MVEYILAAGGKRGGISFYQRAWTWQSAALQQSIQGPYLQKIFGPEFDYEAIRARRKQLMKEHIEKNGIEKSRMWMKSWIISAQRTSRLPLQQGGTINEDDHMFGLTCAKKYGGIYVPPHQAVIHQFAREMLAGGGKMILGSDSHTRYGALGTMAIGEGGPELVKQLLNKTYDIDMPGVVGIYLTGTPQKGVGPQDIALAIIGAVFGNGFVKNKVMEFVGPGVSKLSADYRIGIDVMTTETTCLSSIWRTDDKVEEFYAIHGRSEDYKELNPGDVAYYDGMIDM